MDQSTTQLTSDPDCGFVGIILTKNVQNVKGERGDLTQIH